MTSEDPGRVPASTPPDTSADSDLARSILVVDANPDISDLVRLVLEDTGRYRVLKASTIEDAIQIVDRRSPDLVILDFNLPDLAGPELVNRLREARSDLNVIVIPLNEKLKGARLSRDQDGEIISRPFYLPELPSIVESALGSPDVGPAKHGPPPDTEGADPALEPKLDLMPTVPEAEQDLESYIAPALKPYEPLPQWLEEPDEAAFYLSDIILESSAIAGLLTRQGELWSATQGMPQSQIQDITRMVGEDRGAGAAGGEWIRVLRPGTGGDDFRLYTAPVMGDIDLTLVFPATISLAVIREQARQLTKLLSDVDPLSFEV